MTESDSAILETLITKLLEGVELESKTETAIGYHGSSQGEEITYTIHYNPYRRTWEPKEFALMGHVFSEIKPIILKIINKNGNV